MGLKKYRLSSLADKQNAKAEVLGEKPKKVNKSKRVSKPTKVDKPKKLKKLKKSKPKRKK